MATTWNPSDKGANVTLTNGNNTATGATSTNGVRSVATFTNQSVYFEIEVSALSSFSLYVGVSNGAKALSSYSNDGDAIAKLSTLAVIDYNGSNIGSGIPAIVSTGNRYAVAVNGSTLQFALNKWDGSTWSGWYGSTSGADPAAGTGMADFSATFTSSTVKYIYGALGSGDAFILRSAAADWLGTPPSGFGEIGTYSDSVSETASASDSTNATANSLSQLWQPNAFAFFPQATASGNTYNDSTAETGSAADTTDAATVRVGANAETASAADTPSASLVAAASVAETGSASDTPSAALVVSGTVAETASAVDTPSAAQTAAGTVGETGSASDTPSAGLVAVATTAETGSAADTLSAALAAVGTVSETGSASDTVSTALVAAATVAETASAADTTDGTKAGNTYNDSVAETASAADTTSAASVRAGAVAETGSASDTVSAAQVAVAAVSEAGSAAETLSATAVLGASVSEVGSAVDSPDFIPSQTYNETVAESAAANDNTNATGGQQSSQGLPFGTGGGRAYSRRKLEEILAELRAEDEAKVAEARREEDRAAKTRKAKRKAAEEAFEREVSADPVSAAQKALKGAEKADRIVEALREAIDRETGRAGILQEALAGAIALIEDMEDEMEALAALLLSRAA